MAVRTRINRLAVIGGGEMGSNISTVCALGGREVVIRDLSAEILDASRGRIERNLTSLIEAEEVTPTERDAALQRISTTSDLREAAANADLVIEAVFEDLALKQEVFKELESTAGEDVILASNSAGIPTSEIAALCAHPERVVGIHFFNPPFIFRAVEAIRGEKTSDETFDTAIGFIESIGSVPIRVFRDQRSFVINKMQIALQQVAAQLIKDGVTTAEDIDKAAQNSFGARYATYGVLRGTEMIRPGTPLRRGIMKGEGLNFDYSAYTMEELFRRRDQAFVRMIRAGKEARKAYPIE